MKLRKFWLLAGLPLALMACEAEEEPLEDDLATVETVEPVEPIEPVTTPGAGMAATTINLQPLNNSGTMGEATLSEAATGTQVMVRLTNATPGEHAGHIHQGTCDNLGSVVTPLQPITVDGGTGMMTTTVDIPLGTVTNGQHLIAYHEAGGNPGAVITCGEIPATTM